MGFYLLLTFIVSSYAIAKGSSDSAGALPEEVRQLLKKHKIPNKNLSVSVKELSSGKSLISHNIDVSRNPASTMKLLTTYAALKTLKPNYSWKTEAWIRGSIKSGVLKGDLILKGYGDPFLIHEKYWKFVQGIRDRGLKKITGNIIIDNSYFDIPKTDPGKFDNRPFRTYNAIPSALMYNFQATRLLFRPDKEEKRIDIIPYPWIPEYSYTNRVKYSSKRCARKHHRPTISRTKNKVIIAGSYSAQCGQQYILRAISEADEHAYNGFRDFWRGMGGELTGTLKKGKVTQSDKRFHTYYSDSLGDQIRVINKWSNNVMTRQLLLTLGAKKYGAPGTLEKGRTAILDVLEENNIDHQGIIIDNGSGLSRIARITTRQHMQLLQKAWNDPFMPEFMSSLALSGLDGTMVKRFRKGDQRGRSHMKTGTLRNSKAIAGYMLTRKGKWLAVVIHHNGPKIGGGRGSRIQDAMLRWSFEK
ncbi:MAG: D-alanyl-D-alanine carboxypeptidase (EC [uncultured Thiotrichaceae bacterium]|uniref:D-alanyl-D-alanine carboxypeptidase (EC) n=1 Tax=uncultured Thiotrichaceae bacterium TaxID=298394 RepID=A0A6S6U4P8_9GAMM|nr:MAG: D-alanyl-D-alanine carboxypeptidase (EC [uncultured Thiotrichaceae bacterium]